MNLMGTINQRHTSRYVRHSQNKQNTPVAVKNPVEKTSPYTNKTDTSDILDLSGMKNKGGAKTYQDDESAAILELTEEAREKLSTKSIRENERAEEVEGEGEDIRPSDETRKLTRMLVNAKTPDEVQGVLADTYNHMREWQKLAANGDKEAIKVVRKLNRLVSRGNRKITDLNKEIVMHQRQQRAEKAEKNQQAKRLEQELKEAQRERKARERRYLRDRDNDNEDEESEFGPTMAETEAIIRQLAGQMAALKTNAVDATNTGSFDGTTDIGMSDSSIESAEVSGQETTDE
ncbi:MAG: hypothetical protein FWD38_00440 [Oscillospiraceae bacterium]|nr:hypothetical protein [Oscillospiraceae bacterium]